MQHPGSVRPPVTYRLIDDHIVAEVGTIAFPKEACQIMDPDA